MDWRLVLSTFVAVFIAETGDKTQLATLSLASGSTSRWSVFLGSASALVATSAIAVLVGASLAKVIPPIWLKRAAGVVFIVLGVVYLLAKEEPAEPAEAAAPAPSSKPSSPPSP